MKLFPNPFIKRNNDQIKKEQTDHTYPMIWCEKYKINVNYKSKEMCPSCIFWKKEEKKCYYDKWLPGLKKGKNG